MGKLDLQQGEHNRGNEDLARSIKQMISKTVKELISEGRAKKKENASSDVLRLTAPEPKQRSEDGDGSDTVNERKRKGRSIKNPVVGEKVVFFSLPDDCDAEHIRDLDKVKERLGEWMIQRRQRDSKLTDTYYCHLGSSLTFRSVKEVADFIISESVPKVNLKRKQGKSAISESSSKKVKGKNKAKNLEAISSEELAEDLVDSINNANDAKLEAISSSEELAENIVDSINNAKDVINSSPTEIVADSHLDKFYCELQLQTYEELNSLQFEPCDDLPTIFSCTYQKEIGKENSAEVQAVSSTESVEAPILATEVDDQESEMVKEHSEEEETSLQENCGRELETVEEATEKIGNAKLDGANEDDFNKDDIYDQLPDLTMSWKSKYGSHAYFHECDLWNMPTEEQILTTEANDGETQKIKHSKKVDSTLQGCCGQEFETLDEAAKRVEDDFADNIYGQLEDLNMSRKSNYGISDSYVDECDMFISVPIY